MKIINKMKLVDFFICIWSWKNMEFFISFMPFGGISQKYQIGIFTVVKVWTVWIYLLNDSLIAAKKSKMKHQEKQTDNLLNLV